MSERRSGFTSEQMRNAPNGAMYVWGNSHLGYAKALARYLGREDLVVISPSMIDGRLRGRRVSVVVDHACELSPDRMDTVESARGSQDRD